MIGSDQTKIVDLLDVIGETPLVRLNRISPVGGATIAAKLEFKNPGGSVKDRTARAMVLAAERSGKLVPGGIIVEATSGNTGIALAMIAAVRGYRCMIIMPEDMSVQRRNILRSYGAEVVLTSADEGMTGAVERANVIARKEPTAFRPSQFDNPENPAAHELTTGREIVEQAGSEIVAFVAGIGTGGTITGVGRVLKRERPAVRIVGVEPSSSAVLSGGDPGLHAIQGLGAGFIPPILDRSVIDEVKLVPHQPSVDG